MCMTTDSNSSSISYFLKSLPVSRMMYPETLRNRIKYLFWRFYTPFHPFARDLSLALGIVHHKGRQDYLLGTLAPGQTVDETVMYLVRNGYGNHFIAWHDEGEIVSLRRVESFSRQYHIRIFSDGEVRAHFEYTPECHPVLHMKETHQEQRHHEFICLLGNRIIPTNP